MCRFSLFLLVVSLYGALGLECLTTSGFQNSSMGVLCVECQLRGYLITPEECFFTIQEPDPVDHVYDDEHGKIHNITCPIGQCRHFLKNECVESKRGIPCFECNGAGFMVDSVDMTRMECKCYSSKLDPRYLCLPSRLSNYTKDGVQFRRRYDKVTCKPHRDDILGCFGDLDSSNHKYGEERPPTPHRCCSDIYGPPPGELVENEDIPLQTCNTFGTVDPDTRNGNTSFDLAFKTCSGHGVFNFSTRVCECDKGWKLGYIGTDVHGNDVQSCIQCDGHFGPSPYSAYDSPPYCRMIFSPSPITGISEECGGRGKYYLETGCSCYSNSTTGYWKLGRLGGRFTDNGTEIFAESCIECESGVLPSCLP